MHTHPALWKHGLLSAFQVYGDAQESPYWAHNSKC